MKSALAVCVLALCLPLAAEAPLCPGRFDAGVGTTLELTDAQLALTQAQNTQAQAPSDFRIALAQLDRAAGRR